MAKGGILGDLAQLWHNLLPVVPGDGWWIGAEVGGDMVLTSEGSPCYGSRNARVC